MKDGEPVICFWKINPPFSLNQLFSTQQIIMGDALSAEQNRCTACQGKQQEMDNCDKAIPAQETPQNQ